MREQQSLMGQSAHRVHWAGKKKKKKQGGVKAAQRRNLKQGKN